MVNYQNWNAWQLQLNYQSFHYQYAVLMLFIATTQGKLKTFVIFST
jgi:hypothetical protein